MWGVRLLTFGLPWVVLPGVENPYLEPKALLLTVGGWGLILWRHFRLQVEPSVSWRNPWTVWLAGWVVGVSCWKFQWFFLHRSPGQSRIIYNEYVWFACGTVLMALLLAQTLSTVYLKTELAVHRLTQWMCWSALIAALYGLCQAIGWDQFYASNGIGQTSNPVWAGFGNPGYLALYLAILFPLFFIFAHRRYLLYAGIVLMALWLTQTFYAIVIAGIGLFASLAVRWWERFDHWQRWGVLGLVAGGIGLLFNVGLPLLQADEVRLPVWSQALAFLQNTEGDTPKVALSMTGYGLEAFPILAGGETRWAHNEWVQMLVEIGVIGTGLLLGMVLWSLKSGWQAATHSITASGWFGVWVAFLIASLVHFPGHIPPIAFVGLCAWSLMEQGGQNA